MGVPLASSTAAATRAYTGMIPPSPAPFTPSELFELGQPSWGNEVTYVDAGYV